jgi:hypothetical protein
LLVDLFWFYVGGTVLLLLLSLLGGRIGSVVDLSSYTVLAGLSDVDGGVLLLLYQVDVVHFDISVASVLVQHALLLHILGACGLMHDCLNWFQSCLTGRLFLVKIAGIFFLFWNISYCLWCLYCCPFVIVMHVCM